MGVIAGATRTSRAHARRRSYAAARETRSNRKEAPVSKSNAPPAGWSELTEQALEQAQRAWRYARTNRAEAQRVWETAQATWHQAERARAQAERAWEQAV